MLLAMKEQLRSLAVTDKEKFHAHLKDRVGKRATVILEDRLIEIIVLMPDLVGRVYMHWSQNQHQSDVKKLGGYLLTYLYTPEDFLSMKEWGLFGYLDDAYFVAKVYTQVIDDVTASGGRVAGVDLQFYKQAKYLKKYVRGVIPLVTKKIDKMVEELRAGNETLYEEVFA